MLENVIDATARFAPKPERTEDKIAHREVIKRSRQTLMSKIGSNDNKPAHF